MFCITPHTSESPGTNQEEFLRVKSETDAAEKERALMLASLPPDDPEKHAIEGFPSYYSHTYALHLYAYV